MTHSISAALLTHLSSTVTTTALIMKVTRTDAVELCSTDHDQAIPYDGDSYLPEIGNIPTTFQSTTNLEVENVTLEGPYVLTGIKYSDILAGKYDNAQVEISLINYANTSQGVLATFSGNFGEVGPCEDKSFKVEILGPSHKFEQVFGTLYSPGCRHELGDGDCPVTLSEWTETGTIATATNNHEFTCTDLTDVNGHTITSGWFIGGNLTFTSGDNNGLSFEIQGHVKDGSTHTFTFHENTYYSLIAGNAFSVYAGCQLRFDEDCVAKFGADTDDGASFDGEPHLPGQDAVMIRPEFHIP